ncbi:hypothetical protein DFH29DRAFT_881266 [Suillus ampliporus]|nr:hypothetical protein DFH29DRAFT_881266 [Suillus ampliporus]
MWGRRINLRKSSCVQEVRKSSIKGARDNGGARMVMRVPTKQLLENRVVLLGKHKKGNSTRRTSGDSKVTVYQHMGAAIFPQLHGLNAVAVGDRVKRKYEQHPNTVSSSADPGQDFESSALQYFNASGSKDVQIPGENELDGEDDLLEDREIMDVDSTDIGQDDVDSVGDVAAADTMALVDRFFHAQQPSSSRSSLLAPVLTRASTPFTLPSFQHLHPPVTPISTRPSDENVISLNSPEPLAPEDSDIQSDNYPSFFSNLARFAPSHDATLQDSDDSDISARHAMQGLRIDSHKPSSPVQGRSASQVMELSGASTRSGSPQSPPVTRPPSRKRTNDNQTSISTEQLSDTAQALIQSISEKRDDRAEHDHIKRMKMDYNIWSKDLKVHNAQSEREHSMCLAEQDFMHKCDLMGHQLEQTKLELAHAHRDEEEARIRWIAIERGMDPTI